MLWDETPAGIPLSSFEITGIGGGTHVIEHKADFVEEKRVAYPLRVRADKGNQCLSFWYCNKKSAHSMVGTLWSEILPWITAELSQHETQANLNLNLKQMKFNILKEFQILEVWQDTESFGEMNKFVNPFLQHHANLKAAMILLTVILDTQRNEDDLRLVPATVMLTNVPQFKIPMY